MKNIIIILSLILVLTLSSCSDVYSERILSDAEQYEDMWELSERRVYHNISQISLLFPKSINEKQCIDFSCKHTTYQIVGTGWQVLLNLKYNDDEFANEVKRLSDLCADSPVCGLTEYFDLPAYASVWNWACCYEYAIVDKEEKTISYVYLQLINKDHLCLEDVYVPNGYDQQMEGSEFTVYSVPH